MPQWLLRVLEQIRNLAAQHKVRFTRKARRELAALGLGLDPDDAIDVLANLTAAESAGRLISDQTGEWMYVFKPRIAETIVYLKLIVRGACILVSFHEDEEG